MILVCLTITIHVYICKRTTSIDAYVLMYSNVYTTSISRWGNGGLIVRVCDVMGLPFAYSVNRRFQMEWIASSAHTHTHEQKHIRLF